jgi:MoaA/NifB/PqqE/SkfB family radical SAM enzyme
MIIKLGRRILSETDKRLLFKFLFNFGWKGIRAVRRFRKRVRQGEFFPAFLFLSVTDKCNLNCQGCWITSAKTVHELDLETMESIISQSKQQGNYFFGILGGEPLMFHGLFDVLKNHPECYFLLFTNGTLITDEIAAKMYGLGNVTPLISIEGKEEVSDLRRGGRQVYSRTMRGLRLCRDFGLITGVATSICKSNIDDLASEAFIHELIEHKVHYLWYYIYRPVGPNPSPELALSQEEVLALRQFIVDIRKKVPLLVVDSYWDHRGRAICPAAVGLAHHINPNGDIEPCPPIQFARDNVGNGKSLYDIFNDSQFLERFRDLVCRTTRGCILMEQPALLEKVMREEGARDTSGRGRGLSELRAMTSRSSHHLPGKDIPEKSWFYRFAKKHWFFGFGAYG